LAEIPVNEKVSSVAPEIADHEPVPVGEDSHCKVMPAVAVWPVALNLMGVVTAANETDVEAVPPAGVPEQAELLVPFKGTLRVVAPPPVIARLPE
jgi:hypothetical protein